MSPRQMAEHLEGIKSEMIEIAGECMLEKAVEIKELLVAQQHIYFTDSAGAPLRTYFRKYVFDFSSSPAPFSLPTKFMEDLTAELYLTVEGDLYAIKSDAVTANGELKSEFLKEWNGSEIMDLSPDNEALIYPIIEDSFREKIQERLAWD